MPELLDRNGSGNRQDPPTETALDGDGYGDQYKHKTIIGETTFGEGVTARRIYGLRAYLMDYSLDPNRLPRDVSPAHLLGARMMLLSELRLKEPTIQN